MLQTRDTVQPPDLPSSVSGGPLFLETLPTHIVMLLGVARLAWSSCLVEPSRLSLIGDTVSSSDSHPQEYFKGGVGSVVFLMSSKRRDVQHFLLK